MSRPRSRRPGERNREGSWLADDVTQTTHSCAGISTPPIKLYESPGLKIELKFSGKAGGGNWQGGAVLQGKF